MLTTFEGFLKQLDVREADEISRQLFELAFPKFEAEARVEKRLEEAGIKYEITSEAIRLIGGERARRFAGDIHLPRGQYHTVATGASGFDGGTLVNELYAYHSGSNGVGALILDTRLERVASERWLGDKAFDPKYESGLFICFQQLRVTAENEKIFAKIGSSRYDGFFPCKCEMYSFDRVIDLRSPPVREDFRKVFSELEIAGKEAAVEESGLYTARLPEFDGTALEFLKLLLKPAIGGANSLGQAIGLWCRQNDVAGIVFPSARSNAYVEFQNGIAVNHGGWNFVCFVGAPQNDKRPSFGFLNSWKPSSDLDYIKYVEHFLGQRSGSLVFRGMKERNPQKVLIDRESAIQGEMVDGRAISTLVGHEQHQLSQSVLKMLAIQDQSGIDPLDSDLEATVFLEGSGLFKPEKTPRTSKPAEVAQSPNARPVKKSRWWKFW